MTFLRRLGFGKDEQIEDSAGDGSSPARCLGGTGRSFAGFGTNDRPVKFWVPDVVRQALDELAEYHDSDLSKLVRHLLFVHLYGQYELQAAVERGERAYLPGRATIGEEGGACEVRYSRRATDENRTADLGKNLNDIKVFLPAPMAEELDRLAEDAGITRSEFVREALVAQLFGRTQLPDRR